MSLSYVVRFLALNPNLNFPEPMCRLKQPLAPFYVPGDRCHVHVCKIRFNYVYLESQTIPGCCKFYQTRLLWYFLCYKCKQTTEKQEQ